MTKCQKALTVCVFSLLLVLFAAAPALAEDSAPGESGGGSVIIGGSPFMTGSGTFISIEAPASISGWSLRPDQENSVGFNVNITTDGNWSLKVNDTDLTTLGYMTEYNKTSDEYVTPTHKLDAVMRVKATGENGTDSYVNLPGGGIIAQNTTTLTGETNIEVPITLNQTVSWGDEVSAANRGYKIVITFTGSLL